MHVHPSSSPQPRPHSRPGPRTVRHRPRGNEVQGPPPPAVIARKIAGMYGEEIW